MESTAEKARRARPVVQDTIYDVESAYTKLSRIRTELEVAAELIEEATGADDLVAETMDAADRAHAEVAELERKLEKIKAKVVRAQKVRAC